MVTYYVRIVCEGPEIHYYRETQTELNENIICTTHPVATVRDFVIERVEQD